MAGSPPMRVNKSVPPVFCTCTKNQRCCSSGTGASLSERLHPKSTRSRLLMEPYAPLLGDLEPHSLVELGHPDPHRGWMLPESLAAAQVVHLDDRDGLA